MDTQSAGTEIVEIEQYPFVLGSVSKSKSGAEMLADWEEQGCFEIWAEQYKDIGPGKKYADSTEYVQAMRI
ncbi:MAG: hypothetical protein ACRYFS_05260 [Janthinobacterium lividum]